MRDEWTFRFDVGEVLEGAQDKLEHHQARQRFWEEEERRAMEAIEAKGLDVRQHEVSGGRRAQVVVDPELADRLGECQRKIEKHRNEEATYGAWIGVLKRETGPRELQLDHQDVLFFGLDIRR